MGCEQRGDHRLIQTDVRHKQLKFDLNIYKNQGSLTNVVFGKEIE